MAFFVLLTAATRTGVISADFGTRIRRFTRGLNNFPRAKEIPLFLSKILIGSKRVGLIPFSELL